MFQLRQSYLCGALKEYTKESPEIMAVFFQFPWAKVEPDGHFLLNFALAIRDYLGARGNGWWSQGIGQPPQITYEIGHALLLDKHYDEHARWRLPRDEIPFLTFQENKKALKYPPNFDHNWKSYYEWRCLPLKSPAALLLHWPLSVYRLLFLMGFVPHNSPVSRRTLVIYYIGVEQELECLPVFGELALLLPNTDIELIMFGQRVYQLTTLAKPPALASREYVFEFTAPVDYGSGTLRVCLNKTGPFCDPITLLSDHPYPYPDVLIGLNASITSYDEWWPVLAISRALKIPFGITDYNRECLVDDEGNYGSIIHHAVTEGRISQPVGCCKGTAMESIHQPCAKALDPFMKPSVSRHPTSYLPFMNNGFTCIVTPRASG
ncbi:hypothetical protein BD410DRAFT_264185 [Rickenella mellea]|uniref:Mitochondrial splicing suppressor 51-like C-terminal domain-containing protein n=1 Tax=Rickenella mellea TaxID=50990 RepID=A0A4Y7PIP8_9AGAM|nr:hypothetical protein BD410DRAFT_264185 [Rickenella mellea]